MIVLNVGTMHTEKHKLSIIIIKTAMDNKPDLTIEGYYIPFDDTYLSKSKYYFLIISESYIQDNFISRKKKQEYHSMLFLFITHPLFIMGKLYLNKIT